MAHNVEALPILRVRDRIESAIREHQVVVVAGQTGSGKTTQLPQICLDMGLGRAGVIGHTQPRRLAARAVAARIAQERGEALGGAVGVKVRFLDQTSQRTRIKVMTDGMLLAELAGDPKLGAYSTIIIDEAHERSLNIDFLLGYLRRLLPERPDLKIVITSATIDTERFSAHFGGPGRAPVIEVSGRMFPVEVRYRPAGNEEDDGERVQTQAVADAVEDVLSVGGAGDVLVFLPGEREIRSAAEALRRSGTRAEILPLFSRLSNQEQDRIFRTSDRPRVILATNIAETSLTVPGIRFVVDTGVARQSRYDPARKIQRLPIEPISRASADQRAGRCGRVAAGVCVRLYSAESFASRPAFTDPEIRRTNLASVILQMKALDLGPVEEFPFIDPPDAGAVRDGYETLFELGALESADPGSAITPIGRAMSRMPVDPRVARMLLGAEREGALGEVLVLAAALSIQDPRERPMSRQQEADRAQLVFRDETSDFLTLLKLWEQHAHAASQLGRGELMGWCREHFLSPVRMREWQEMEQQLRQIAQDLGLSFSEKPATPEAIHRALLTGLISNLACRESEPGSFEYRGVRGNSVQIFPGSVLFKKGPRWIMAAEVVQTTRLFARTVARVEPEWVEELAGHMFRRQLSGAHLEAGTGEPIAWERLSMSGVVIVPRRRAELAASDPRAAREIFLRDALAGGAWRPEPAIAAVQQIRAVLDSARSAEAKLRRRGLRISDDELAAWLDARLPARVCNPATLAAWLAENARNAEKIALSTADVLKPEAPAALDPARFPDALEAPGTPAARWAVEYALAPGKDEDGLTITVPLLDVPRLDAERLVWLVPGFLEELVLSLMKQLPKAARARIEAHGLADAAAAVAGVLEFGAGALTKALSEAVHVLYGIEIEPAAWALRGLPAHLQMRVRVVDDAGETIAHGRDVAAMKEKLAARIARAKAERARTAFARTGITTWDFEPLPERVTDDAGREAYPAIIDDGASVSLTLAKSAAEAERLSILGVRRLCAIACKDEVRYHIEALAEWPELQRHHGQLGTNDELRDAMTCIIAERVFLTGQAPITSGAELAARLELQWGRLSAAARETGQMLAKILEPRFLVAKRLSGGTPRLWAKSVADLREQAAYLMPRGFLLLTPAERLRQMPRYAQAMRERLLALREDGSGVETAALERFLPHWKKFTAWVAGAMSRERAAEEDAERAPAGEKGRGQAPLPPARRAAPLVNLDAGEWTLKPGKLTGAVEQYRWALEELRVSLFTPELSAKPAMTETQAAALAKAAGL